MGRYLCNPLYIILFLPGILAGFGESGFGSVDSLYMLNRGITPIELGGLVGIFYLAITLAEFPTAIIFDRTFSKKIIYVGLIIKILAYGAYAISASYLGFAVAQIAAGIGTAALSGSIGAFIINHFEDKSYKNIGAVTSEWNIVRSIASLIGGGIGLFLFHQTDWLVWVFAALMTMLCIISFIRVPNLPPPSQIEKFSLKGLVFLLADFIKRPLFIAVALQDVALVGLVMFWQPRISEVGGWWLYYGFIIITFSSAISSLAFRYYLPRLKHAAPFAMVNAVLAAAVVLTPSGYTFLVFFALHIVASNILGTIVNVAFAESLDDRHRATAGSFVSLISGGLMMLLGPLAGWVGQSWGIAVAGWITVVIFLIMSGYSFRSFRDQFTG